MFIRAPWAYGEYFIGNGYSVVEWCGVGVGCTLNGIAERMNAMGTIWLWGGGSFLSDKWGVT